LRLLWEPVIELDKQNRPKISQDRFRTSDNGAFRAFRIDLNGSNRRE
jgi:hypothetical protein